MPLRTVHVNVTHAGLQKTLNTGLGECMLPYKELELLALAGASVAHQQQRQH